MLLIFAKPIARLYIPGEGELLNLTAFAIRMIALQTPLNGILRPRISYLQVTGHIREMQVMTFLAYLGYSVLSAFVLGSLFGTYGVLACFFVGDLLSLLTIWVVYSIKNRKLMPTTWDYMNLPADFHRDPGDVIYLDIRDMEDVSLVSEQMSLFCKGHRIDGRIGYRAAVSFEELASNIIRHGFPVCRRTPRIDLCVVAAQNELVIRIKDNCRPFNVERHIAIAISEKRSDLEHQLGLRLLGSIDSDIKYVHSLETNNVILRFPLDGATV